MKGRHDLILILTAIIVILVLVGVASFFTGPTRSPKSSPAPAGAGMANPAAVYCTKMNNRYEIRTAPDGSQSGVCILPDGTACDEWEYYRGRCPAGITPGAATPDIVGNFCLSRNNQYQTREEPGGNQVAVCIFPDGRECDARAYYEGTCNETTAKRP